MTPKEKAKELVLKYFNSMNENYDCISWKQSKECALACVDEILPIMKDFEKKFYIEFYDYVKQEIEKL